MGHKVHERAQQGGQIAVWAMPEYTRVLYKEGSLKLKGLIAAWPAVLEPGAKGDSGS